jgi:hypothetical protein
MLDYLPIIVLVIATIIITLLYIVAVPTEY